MHKFTLDQVIHFIVHRGKLIEKVFFIAVVLCGLSYPFVGVNYDMSTYLPESTETKQALDLMEDEFGYPGMARIMLSDVTLYEAKAVRDKIADVDGVSLAIGPDVTTNAYMPESFGTNELTDRFYKNGNAEIQVIFEDGDSDKSTHRALEEIYKIAGPDANFAGSAVSCKEREEAVTKEVAIAMVIALVIIFIILALTTDSWFEPFLFIMVMVIAIILNMGSNIIFGEISFFTFSTAAILQLAVSMDYSIFLLHTFKEKKKKMEREAAMESALKDACRSILSSGATTIIGFIVMVLMQFMIGKDIGLVLTKGILCSLISVLFLMPTLILKYDSLIEKYKHKSFVPSFDKFSNIMYGIRGPVLIGILILAIPCYIGQSMNTFYYGDDAMGTGPGTKVYEDARIIDREFGKSNMILAIVPNGSTVREKKLSESLEDLDFVNYVVSLSGSLPAGIPEDFLPKDVISELRTENYTRMLISIGTVSESAYAFECSDRLTETVHQFYPTGAYIIGMTPTTMEIRNVLTVDYNKVSLISLIGVIIVVMITFRSVLVPIFVVIPIEVALFLNMTMQYVWGESMVYMDYIIINCVQLGATIDYSILLTNNYLDMRKQMDKIPAAKAAISKSALSVLTSGSILMVVGYLLFFTSSVQAISQVGRLVGRGTMLSIIMVLSLLPALLSFFDKYIMNAQKRAAEKKRKRLEKIQKENNIEGLTNSSQKGRDENES